MTKLSLTYAGRDYDRTHALIDGKVRPKDTELRYIVVEDPDQIFRRMISHKEFDSCEFSLSSYLASRSAGDESYVALPVFPSRVFRHSYIFCNTEAKISEPADLVGAKVGIPEWQQTASIWIKGILQHEYDVPIRLIDWVRFRGERYPMKRVRKFKILEAPDLTPETSMERAGVALEKGEIDALISSRPPAGLYNGKRTRRLFVEWKAEEERYFKRTGIFPIMHTVVLQRQVYEKNPWVAKSLFDAFQTSKESGYRYLEDHGDKISLAWARSALEEQRALMGPDPYPYGLGDNRKTISTFMEYQREQEVIARTVRLDDVFLQDFSTG
ncbi:MAG: ABC transporter substrate-binding protein [Thaumarchaeota archaeon]|nr:ABC transporter substrate-binding protein [Nitrososphaerota archaeon]